MSTTVSHDDITPPDAPRHQCINASCGCNDLISGGACSEWCMANTTELSAVQAGKSTIAACECAHDTCRMQAAATPVGTRERGMA